MFDPRPIGIFDSGVGGLTVWAEIASYLPHESTLYVADEANCPYGPRKAEEVIVFSTAITQFLLDLGCKLIVVACNTASAAALNSLRTQFAVPFVGLEPAVKPAAQATNTGHIGILATEGTFRGELFKNTAQTYADGVTIHSQVAHGLVSLVEAGQLTGAEPEAILRHYLEPMLKANVDQLVLGCTHYPFLTPLIQKITAGKMAVLNPANAIARQVERLLNQHTLAADEACFPGHRFYSTGEIQVLVRLLKLFEYHNPPIIPLQWQSGTLSVTTSLSVTGV